MVTLPTKTYKGVVHLGTYLVDYALSATLIQWTPQTTSGWPKSRDEHANGGRAFLFRPPSIATSSPAQVLALRIDNARTSFHLMHMHMHRSLASYLRGYHRNGNPSFPSCTSHRKKDPKKTTPNPPETRNEKLTNRSAKTPKTSDLRRKCEGGDHQCVLHTRTHPKNAPSDGQDLPSL